MDVMTTTTTHIVVNTVVSEKCTEAYSKSIPLMTEDWIRIVWKESQKNIVNATDEKFSKFKCPIFYNLKFCLSQVSNKTKAILRNIIEQNGESIFLLLNFRFRFKLIDCMIYFTYRITFYFYLGGSYSPHLIKKEISVLVLNKAEGDKYRHSKQWGIPCVTRDWIHFSIDAGHVLPYEEFLVTASDHPLSSTPTDHNKVKSMYLPLPVLVVHIFCLNRRVLKFHVDYFYVYL